MEGGTIWGSPKGPTGKETSPGSHLMEKKPPCFSRNSLAMLLLVGRGAVASTVFGTPNELSHVALQSALALHPPALQTEKQPHVTDPRSRRGRAEVEPRSGRLQTPRPAPQSCPFGAAADVTHTDLSGVTGVRAPCEQVLRGQTQQSPGTGVRPSHRHGDRAATTCQAWPAKRKVPASGQTVTHTTGSGKASRRR